MKPNTLMIAAVVGTVAAAPTDRRAVEPVGPYGVGKYTTDSSLPSHTIYMPSSPGNASLPVLVWGNGGCGSDGTSSIDLLEQFVSYGYLAIASGAPKQSGSTTAALMTKSIDFAVANAGKGAYKNVDATKIMAAGFSCGGVEAYAQSWDSRISTIGIFSSGLLTNYTAASTFTKPILYVLGGSGDIAYSNGERDFKALPANTPSWKGNLPLGHGGDLFSARGGLFGKAGINWAEWLFRNDSAAAAYLKSGYSADKWTVETHALDKLKTPV